MSAALDGAWLLVALRAMAVALTGLLLGWLGARLARRLLAERASAHVRFLVARITFWTLAGLFLASALRELGFSLGVVLGAAGVLSVAVGFASQTSASNLISGLFLMGERPFSVGDVIRVGDTTGEVLAIDALSVKVRTFDNLYVRLPNETLIKTPFVNLTRFPIRRLDMQIGVAYHEDIDRVREVLERVADAEPLALEEPPPLFIFQGYGDSALQLQFSVWARREDFLALRNRLHIAVKRAFDDAGIEIPFPHRTLYAGSRSEPFAVRVVDDGAASRPDRPG